MEQKIKHIVIFSLKYELNSRLATEFLEEGRRLLTNIPTVQDFELLKEISKDNNYQYGFAMEFSNNKDYEFYHNHPFYQQFKTNLWDQAVTSSFEMNFQLT